MDKVHIQSEYSQPLLSRIDELNEINPESYNRIVERRDSVGHNAAMTETPTLIKNCSRPATTNNSDV